MDRSLGATECDHRVEPLLRRALAIVGCALLLICASPAEGASKAKGRGAFWKEFRKSFLKKDFKALTAMTRFPVEVKGVMEDDPILRVPRKRFEKCFAQVYAVDSGLSVQGQTHVDFVETAIQAPQSDSDELFQVADLAFEKGRKGYELVRFHLDTTHPQIKLSCR